MFCLSLTNADINLDTAQRIKEESEHVKADESTDDNGLVVETDSIEKPPSYDEKKQVEEMVQKA